MIITKYGETWLDSMKQYSYGWLLMSLQWCLLPCVGIAILLKQIVTEATDFIPFFVDLPWRNLRIELGIQSAYDTLQ